VITTVEGLPEYIKEILSPDAQEYFLKILLLAYKNYGEDDSMHLAWEATKLKIQKVGTVYVTNNYYNNMVKSLDMSPEETNIAINSDTEEIIMDAVLADTNLNTDGKYFTEQELVTLAEQINTFGSTVPDVDHEKLMTLVKKHGRDHDAIMTELKNEKGIMKNIKASVEKGRLWVRATLDKRFKNHLDKFKALSIEAFADVEQDGRYVNPQYLGFTFTNNPKLKGAQIAQ
jgi:cation transport regulator ChaB